MLYLDVHEASFCQPMYGYLLLQDGFFNPSLQDGTEHLVKEVATGNSIHSLLSILDVLTVWRVQISTVAISSLSHTIWYV